jgi:hypothetical protein
MADKPLTRTALQTVRGQADASDRLLHCDDPGIPRCSPQSIATPCSPVVQANLIQIDPELLVELIRIDPELLFVDSLRHGPSSLPRKSIPPPGKRQKWVPGSDNRARVVQGLHGSGQHPMDPTRSKHSQPDAFAPSANRDRHSTQEGLGQARMPFRNSGDPNEEEANLAPCAGLDSVLFLMTSVLGGLFEWKRRQPCPDTGRFQHAISSCV